jgi:ketosteroid isomerase-like protein
MKTMLISAAVLVATIGAAACTKVAAPDESSPSVIGAAPHSDVAAIITELEHDWVNAIVAKDTATLDRIIAEDFNGTTPEAYDYPKAMAIDDIKTGTYAVDSMALDDVSVNVYGDTAVSFTSQREKSRYAGEDRSGHYHFTDVWVKRGGQWQVVASHGSRVGGFDD